MVILTDILKNPIDEGAKVATLNLLKHLKRLSHSHIIAVNSDTDLLFIDDFITLNKFLFNLSFYSKIKKHYYRKVLYIPEASITFYSCIRAKLLQLFTGKDIYILSFQPRRYNALSRFIVKIIKPQSIITQSKDTFRYLSDMGITTHILPLGVDDIKYSEFDVSRKNDLRKKYAIQQDKTVLLHVGHIQQSRNLEWLVDVKIKCPDIEVIIVGSTYRLADESLYTKLTNAGIRVFSDYIKNMEDIYNLADYYVFPVKRDDGAIGTPLSVLEALACNLPVITTRFGSLPDVFIEDECFYYVDSIGEVIAILKNIEVRSCNNRKKIELFTWEHIAHQLVEIIN